MTLSVAQVGVRTFLNSNVEIKIVGDATKIVVLVARTLPATRPQSVTNVWFPSYFLITTVYLLHATLPQYLLMQAMDFVFLVTATAKHALTSQVSVFHAGLVTHLTSQP